MIKNSHRIAVLVVLGYYTAGVILITAKLLFLSSVAVFLGLVITYLIHTDIEIDEKL